jgi:hypothetical protein
MFTNYDAQQVLNHKDKLFEMLTEMKDVKPGSGQTEIHLYALRSLLEEIAWYRAFKKYTGG